MEERQTQILYGQGELGKSRSQKKRESTALQNTGEELAALSPAQLAEFGLGEELREALLNLHRIKKYEARRRQMQYIGRLMRELAEEDEAALDVIGNRLETLRGQHRAEAEAFHRLEELRERLLDPAGRAGALEEVKTLYPRAQENRIRHLAEAAAAEKANLQGQGKKSGAARELFRHLRSLAEGSE